VELTRNPAPADAGPPSDHEPAPGHHVATPATHIPLDNRSRPRHALDPRRNKAASLGALGVIAVIAVIAGLAALAVDRGLAPSQAAGAVQPGAPGFGMRVQAAKAAMADVAPGARTSAMLPAGERTLVVGDSLGLVVYPWLADLLPDRYVSYAALVGRSTPSSANTLAQLDAIPSVVLVSSGTNDASASTVEASAREILDALGAERCVVWVDVVRPDRVGDPQAEINAAIGRAVEGRSNVSVLRWSEMIDTHPDWIGGDGIHPTAIGAQARAQAFAAAAQACSPTDPAAPQAARAYLPPSAFSGPIRSVSDAAPSASASTAGPSGSSSASPSPAGSPVPTGSTSGIPSPSATAPTSASLSPVPPAISPTPTVSPVPTVTAQ